MSANLNAILAALLKESRKRGFFIGKLIKLSLCQDAEEEHAASARQFMHTNHYPGVICMCDAANRLPVENKLGLLVHELGHLALLPNKHNEFDANKAGAFATGVPVCLKGSLRLEWSEIPK